MNQQFGKKYRLKISPSPLAPTLLIEPFEIDELEISFKIKKSPLQDANTAEIQIKNLSEEHQKSIFKKFFENTKPTGNILELRAGFLGVHPGELPLIFKGLIVEASTSNDYRQGVGLDRKTVISCMSGIDVLNQRVISKAFTPVQTNFDIVNEGLDQLKSAGFQLPNEQIELLRNDMGLQKPLNIDTTIFSRAWPLTYQYVEKYSKYKIFIDETGCKLIQDGNKPLSPTLHTFTPRTGLLGSPQRTSKGCQIKTLLAPQLQTGDRIRVESRDIQAFYIARSVTHTGEFRGEDWSTSIDCFREDL